MINVFVILLNFGSEFLRGLVHWREYKLFRILCSRKIFFLAVPCLAWIQLFFLHSGFRDYELLQEVLLEEVVVVSLSSFFAVMVVELAFDDFVEQETFKGGNVELLLGFDGLGQLAFEKVELPPHNRVPVVLYGVVCSAFDQLCEDRPFIPIELVKKEEHPLLALSPGLLGNRRMQVVVP